MKSRNVVLLVATFRREVISAFALKMTACEKSSCQKFPLSRPNKHEVLNAFAREIIACEKLQATRVGLEHVTPAF